MPAPSHLSPSAPPRPAARPNLDLLRAYAVLLVVLDHTALARNIHRLPFGWAAEWVGFAGVFIFFVHTSLVLMWSLERKPHTLDFYIRRVFRIYPLAIVAILLTIFLHAPVAGPPSHFFEFHRPSHANLLANLLLVQNLGRGQGNLIGVLWSLPLEVQMYLVLPILFAYARRERAVWPLVLVWLLTCAVCRTVFPLVSTSLPMAVPYFLPGIMAYLAYDRLKPRLPAALLLPTVLILTALFMHSPNSRRGWLFCLALGLLLPLFRELRTPWLTRPAHELAKYSFGIYLFHPFALALAFYLLPHRPLALQLSIELLAIALFAVLGYHLVELPFINLGKRVAATAERRYERQTTPDSL